MSAIRSILLHLDATPASLARLTLAHAVAERHSAQITALFGVRPRAATPEFAYSAAAALRSAEEDGPPHERERTRLRDLLVERAPACAWCEVAGDSVRHAFLAEAIYADLLILGQAPAGAEDGTAPGGFVEAVILQSGTPTIVVPQVHRQATVGERTLVAWNGSAAAARSIKGALPLLRGGAEVHVVSWAEHLPAAPFSRIDLGAWLQRHGIDAVLHRRPTSARVAAELAALAAELRADLIVMGCYGHSRIREQVFGGVTRSTLASLPVPILMAH